MGVSRVEFGGRVLIDLMGDSVTPSSLIIGHTAHDADGDPIEGANPYELEDTNAEVETQEDLIEKIQAALVGKAAGGGITPTGTLEITENGTHNVTDFAYADVNVPIPEGYIMPSGAKEVTANGEHDIAQYAKVLVSVPSKEPVTETLNVTENGEYTPSDGVDGFSRVTVNVASSGGDSNLPAGYRRVDYIQFDNSKGLQLIDIGLVGNQDSQFNVLFTWENTTQRHLFGCASSDNKASITSYMNGSWRFGDKYTSKSISSKNPLLPYSALVNKTTISLSSSVTSISGVADFETVDTLLLGGARDADGTLPGVSITGKVFYFKMWQNGEQVRRLVPVVSAEGNYCFFDYVSGNLFDSITTTPLEGGNL